MAKKKFNTKFATKAGLIVLAAGAVGGVGVWVFMPKDSPQKWQQKSDQAYEAHDYRTAYLAYAKALSLAGSPTTEQWVHLADLARYAGSVDPALQLKDREALARALEVDPKYSPALKKLLELEWEIAQKGAPAPAQFSKVRELAEKEFSADPKDKRAAALIPTTTVQAWLRNVDVDQTRLDSDMQAMGDIVDSDPSDQETAFILARGYVKKAAESLKVGRTREASMAYDAAGAMFDKALKSDDQNLMLRLRAIAVYKELSQLDKANSKRYEKRLDATLQRARELAKVDQPGYLEVNVEAANYLLQKNEPGAREAADKIFKDLTDQFPKNQRLRLAYAGFLKMDPATQPKALELLSLPVERADVGGTSLPFEQTRMLDLTTRLMLQDTRLLIAAAKDTDPKERDALLQAVGNDVAKMQQESTEMAQLPQPLVLRARMEMLQQRYVEASRTFSMARQLMERRADRMGGEYTELQMRLAEAYMKSQQTGPAKELLRQVLSDPATRGFIQARMMLIQILGQENDEAGVRREYLITKQLVDSGEAMYPNKEELRRMMQVLDAVVHRMDGQSDEVAKDLSLQPEATTEDQIKKGQLAFQMGSFGEAIRVLQLAYVGAPKDARAAQLYIQALAADGRTEQATKIADEAAENIPGDIKLQLMKIAFHKGTAEDRQKAIEASVERTADPFEREMAFYELLMYQDKRPEALTHLTAAQALRPDDRRVLDQLFQNALVDKKFDVAEAMIPKLAAVNADQANGTLYKFRLAQQQGKLQEALRLGQQLTQDLPQFGESWLRLGQAYAALGDWDAAVNAFQQTLERQATNKDAMRGAIESNYRLDRHEEANRVLTDAIKKFPGDQNFRDMKVEYELSYGDYATAISKREEQARGQEANPAVQAAMGNAYMKAASSSQRAGDSATARSYARKAGEAYARVFTQRPDDVAVLGAIERSSLVSDDPRWAEELMKKSADSAALANKPEPMMVLADYYLNMGQAETAEKAAREAVRRGGTEAQTRRLVADVLVRLGKVDDAISMLDGAEGAKTNHGLQQQRATILIQARRYDAAEQAVRALLKETPNDLDLQNLLTIVLYNEKHFDEALKQINATLVQDPNNASALYYRGVVNLDSGYDLQAAVRDLQVVRDKGLSPEMRMSLVRAYVAIKDVPSSIRELRNIVKVAPGDRIPRLTLIEQLMASQPPQVSEAQALIEEGLAQPALAGSPELLITKARVLLGQKDVKGAVEAATKAMENSKGDAGLLRSYLDILLAAKQADQVLKITDSVVAPGQAKPSWLLVDRAVAKRILNDKEGSLAEFTAAIDAASSQNDDVGANTAVGTMAQLLGADDAIKFLANRLSGEQGMRYRLITAMLYQTQGKMSTALETLEPALADTSKVPPADRARILRFAGTLLVSPGPQENSDRAAAVYREMLALTPDDFLVLNNMAYLMSEKVSNPNYAEALKYSGRAVELLQRENRIEPLVYDTHGWLLVQNGRVSEGINILNAAVNKQNFMEGHYHLGMAYLQAGQGFAKDAVTQLEIAQKLGDLKESDPSYRPKIAEALKKAVDARQREQAAQPGSPDAGNGGKDGK